MSKKTLELTHGVQFVAEKKSVTVKQVESWTENHFSSSGGGGYIHPKFGGHVDAPRIVNNIIERKAIYVADAHNVESEYRLNMPVRQGHALDLYGVSGESAPILVHNKTMEQWHTFSPKYSSPSISQVFRDFYKCKCKRHAFFRRLAFLSILVGVISIALVVWLADYYHSPETRGPRVLFDIPLVDIALLIHILCYPTLLISLLGAKSALRKCMNLFESSLERALRSFDSA